MKPSSPGVLFVESFFLIINLISLLVSSIFRLSISSWFSFGRIYVSRNLFISSKLSNLLVYNCSITIVLYLCDIDFYFSSFISFFFFFNFIATLFIYLFISGCVGSSVRARALSSCGKRGPLSIVVRGPLFIAVRGPLTIVAPPCRGAQAPDAQAQQPWPTGPATPRHAGSSQTRARTRVLRTSRQTPNHCATREAPHFLFWVFFSWWAWLKVYQFCLSFQKISSWFHYLFYCLLFLFYLVLLQPLFPSLCWLWTLFFSFSNSFWW